MKGVTLGRLIITWVRQAPGHPWVDQSRTVDGWGRHYTARAIRPSLRPTNVRPGGRALVLGWRQPEPVGIPDEGVWVTLDDEYPPQIEYPENHSPFCTQDCRHPCHRPYDEWEARQRERRRAAEELRGWADREMGSDGD